MSTKSGLGVADVREISVFRYSNQSTAMKKHGVFFVILFALVTICEAGESVALRVDFGDPMFSKLDDEGKNVIGEYAKFYPKIKDFYKNIRMDITRRSFRHTAAKEPLTYIPLTTLPVLEREELYVVRYNSQTDGNFSRVDSQVKFIQGKTIQADTWAVRLFTPEMNYELTKSNPNNQFYSLTSSHSHEISNGVMSLEFDHAPLSVAPC